jgi:biopolymer transport protein ExbB
MTFVEELFVKGGPVMWPLLACSLISATLTIERAMFWWRESRREDEERVERMFQLAERRNYDAAAGLGREEADSVARVLASGLAHREHGLVEAMEVAADREVTRMKRGLAVLDTIITLAPMLGILGTVTGIIRSFNLLGSSGIEDPRAATSGLAEALITTAAGLVVALVTLVPFNYFVARVQAAARRLQQVATQFQVTYTKSQATEPGNPCA